MENRIIFRERLTEIREAADKAGGTLTREQIRDMLSDMPLEEEHFQLIYDYLAEQNIRVIKCAQVTDLSAYAVAIPEGDSAWQRLPVKKCLQSEQSGDCRPAPHQRLPYEKCAQVTDLSACAAAIPEGDSALQRPPYKNQDAETGNGQEEKAEGRGSLSFYLDELERFAKQDDREEIRLIEQARSGDEAAKSALIELYLPLICGMAGDYEGDALPPEDLIQEGNLGLISAMQTLMEYDSPAACRAHILNSICRAMEEAVQGGQEYQKLGEGLVSRVNHLNEAVHNLERDLGHRVSAEELSAYLDMPLEEIRSLLNVSGDQISVQSGKKES